MKQHFSSIKLEANFSHEIMHHDLFGRFMTHFQLDIYKCAQSKTSFKRQTSEDSDDTEKMVCKNCNASIKKSIFYHFARTKLTSKCQDAYSEKEIKEMHAVSHLRKKVKQKNYKEKNWI